MLAMLRHALLFSVLAFTGISVAATDAHTVVEQTTNNLLADLKANKEKYRTDPTAFYNAMDAILGSVTVVGKNALMVVGLLLVSYLFAMAGMIALCIGIFFTVPFLYAMIYSIYKTAIGFSTDTQDEPIIKSENYF